MVSDKSDGSNLSFSIFAKQLRKELPATTEAVSTPKSVTICKERSYLEQKYWKNKSLYFLTCVGYIIGIGNFWRFPNLCHKYSSAFFIPYFILLLSTGIPLLLVELTLGQITGKGDTSGWGFASIFRFIGLAKVVLSSMSSIYCNAVMSWSMFYVFVTFLSTELPWRRCDPSWASPLCEDLVTDVNLTKCTGDITPFANGTCYNATSGVLLGIYNISIAKANNIKRHYPAEDYMYNVVLQIGNNNGAIGNLKLLRWSTVLCLMLVSILLFVFATNDIKSSFKAIFLTVFVPYVIITILLIETSSLDGCLQGIIFYLTADFSKLTTMSIWKDAACQIFFSLGIVEGGLMTLASYNRLHNNIVLDTFLFATVDTLTSIAFGFTTFAQLGSFAKKTQSSVKDIAEPGFGLAFITLPQAFARSSAPKTWMFTLFILIINLSIGSELGYVENVKCFTKNAFKIDSLNDYSLLCQIFSLFFTIGLIFATPVGIHIFMVMNELYVWISMATALLTILALTIYGSKRFCRIIEIMIGSKALPCVSWKYLRWYFIICWQILIPIFLVVILFSSWIISEISINSDQSYTFPLWTIGIGIAFTMLFTHTSLSLLVFNVWKRRENLKFTRPYLDSDNPM